MEKEAKREAVYPGSFDPVTNGHVDIIRRALNIFDKITVAVFETPPKPDVLFTPEERVGMIKECFKKGENIEVESFSGLLTDYLRKKQIKYIIRGLRAMSDFDREFQMAVVNKKLMPELETVFMATDKKYFYLNSTLVKELARHKGSVEDFVPAHAAKKLKQKLG